MGKIGGARLSHREFLKWCGLAVVGAGASQFVSPPKAAFAITYNENLIVNAPYKVGIGTSSPSYSLHIVNDGSTSGTTPGVFESNDTWQTAITLINDSTNGRTYQFISAGASNSAIGPGSFGIHDGTDFRLVIRSGNVGIGTTNPALGKLEVQGRIGAVAAAFATDTTGTSVEGGWPGVAFNCYYNGGRKLMNSNGGTAYGGGIGMDPATGRIIIYTTTSGTAPGASITSTDRMSISNNGSVGIGTDTPDATKKLHVAGDVKVDGTLDATAKQSYYAQ